MRMIAIAAGIIFGGMECTWRREDFLLLAAPGPGTGTKSFRRAFRWNFWKSPDSLILLNDLFSVLSPGNLSRSATYRCKAASLSAAALRTKNASRYNTGL